MGDFFDTAALPSSHIKVSTGVLEPIFLYLSESWIRTTGLRIWILLFSSKAFKMSTFYFFPIAYLWYICISLHRRQVGILYLEVTRPKLTVLALIQMINDDIHASLLLISLFLHSLHSCCF
jgi:hypothetical protein